MRWVKFSVAVVLTSAALVVALFATGAALVGSALASNIPADAQVRGLHGNNLPPELAGLKDVPASERFAHFKRVQVSLTDRDGRPVDISLTPGVASSVSANSLTLAGNDGTSYTYALDDQTMRRRGDIATGQNVVVVTLGNASNARAVLVANPANWRRGL